MRKGLILTLIIVISLFAVTLTTYSIYKHRASSSSSFETANFSYTVNAAELNLKNTITNNKPLAPGAEGKIVLNIDLSAMEVESVYTIEIERNYLPNNIKFYSDSARTNEIQNIEGTFSINDNTSIKHDVYWKWLYSETDTSNDNDSLYMGTDIQVLFNATFSQKVGGGN